MPLQGQDVPQLGVREFFLLIQPIEGLGSLREFEFLMLYYVKGMSADRVASMDGDERLWWMKRLLKEKKRERGPNL